MLPPQRLTRWMLQRVPRQHSPYILPSSRRLHRKRTWHLAAHHQDQLRQKKLRRHSRLSYRAKRPSRFLMTLTAPSTKRPLSSARSMASLWRNAPSSTDLYHLVICLVYQLSGHSFCCYRENGKPIKSDTKMGKIAKRRIQVVGAHQSLTKNSASSLPIAFSIYQSPSRRYSSSIRAMVR